MGLSGEEGSSSVRDTYVRAGLRRLEAPLFGE